MPLPYETPFPHPIVRALDVEVRAAVFVDPTIAQKWLQQSQYGEFKRSIAWLNAQHQGLPPERHDFASLETGFTRTDASGSDVPWYIAPSRPLRTTILHNTWNAMRRMRDTAAIAQLSVVW
ncbi:MAG TPA: hypothetical protein VLF43_00825 [Candidatus Saccharimonadales bacterium]|nr:hypothetical protein [Candidatus Saccharimonadales bacterium]